MSTRDTYYHRNLPHYHLEGYPLFITFRLSGSLPMDVLAELQSQREVELRSLKINTFDERYKTEKKHFGYYDDWLDQCKFGPQWLHIDQVAQIVLKEIHSLNNNRYQLMAFSVMPNHVHLLIKSLLSELSDHQGMTANYPVADTLRLLKGRTARYCNLELNRNGSFGQHESYDHMVRDEHELEQTIRYILNNPVKAGLVKDWKDWKFTYVYPDFGE